MGSPSARSMVTRLPSSSALTSASERGCGRSRVAWMGATQPDSKTKTRSGAKSARIEAGAGKAKT